MVEIQANQEQNLSPLSGRDAKLKNDSIAPASGHATPEPEAEPELDHDLIREARETLKCEYEINGDKYSSQHYEEIMDSKSPYTCWRYLTHCQFKLAEAIELMKSALAWRKETNLYDSSNHNFIKEFWFHAPMMFSGVSKQGHDVLYIIGRHYRKPDAQLKPIIREFCQNLLFSWDRAHQHDLQQFCFVFDVADTGLKNIDLDFMTWLVSVKDYLPARISQIYVIGTPLLVRPLIRLIISWLPEKFSKIVHCGTYEQLIEPNIDRDQLPVETGGTADERYRLAPIDAPWQSEMPQFMEPSMQKAIHDSIWFHADDARKARLAKNQTEFENRVTNK